VGSDIWAPTVTSDSLDWRTIRVLVYASWRNAKWRNANTPLKTSN